MNHKILIVDNEPSICEFFNVLFKKLSLEMGHLFELTTVKSSVEALELIQNKYFGMVIADLKESDGDALQLLQQAKSLYPDVLFLITASADTTEMAVKVIKMGADDYIPKPFSVEHMRNTIVNAFAVKKQSAGNKGNQNQVSGEKEQMVHIIGLADSIKKIEQDILQISHSSAHVLITGDSGTGKEMVARSIHQNSPLKHNVFVAVNCGAIPYTLIESEMFGHKKGSFTGAFADKKGFFEAANGGTLFLDEIGEMPLALQPKLLRVLQEKVVRMVGGIEDKKIKVRLISATNRDLTKMIQTGEFREDLYYRLNVVHIHVPPLRERKEDIPLLVDHFCKKHGISQNLLIPEISDEVMEVFQEYDYPGNVRELENLVERILILREKEGIFPEDVRSFFREIHSVKKEGGQSGSLKFSLPDKGIDLEKEIGDLEKNLIIQALQKTKGFKKGAADLLGLSLRSFRYRLQKYNLDVNEENE